MVLAIVGIASIGLFWVVNVGRSAYRDDRKISYSFKRVTSDLADNLARQEELSRRLAALEVRQRNIEDVTESSKATIIDMRKLIDELRAQLAAKEVPKK